MTNKRFGALTSVVVLTALAGAAHLTSCSGSCEDKLNCGEYSPSGGTTGGSSGKGGSTSGGSGGDSSGGESGEGGSGGSGGGDECDLDAIETGCTAPSDAIFVAPTGSDEDAGTSDAPVATLTKAVELAGGDKPILVCNATYDEHVVVSGAASIYGGFSCTDWTAEDGTPLFKPASAGSALKIDGVDDALLIENVAFEVPDATEPGGSAVTAIVSASPSVTLRNVTLTAGEGLAGDDGTLTEFEYAAQASLNGNPENPVMMGGSGKTCDCQTDLSSTGGVGGSPVIGGQNGSTGQPDHGGGQGGIPGSCSPDGGGHDGSDAPDRDPSEGAETFGTPSPTGWEPSAGKDGAMGSPGQGGGGGASRNDSGHGGGGGCGGCGGNGGKGGQGGGGSIALLLIDSPVTLEACTLVTSDAGDGGSGHAGQPGQQEVGSGGGVVDNQNSCPGGVGGKGGDGGAGGGGAGGVSAGIVWQGDTAPSVSDDTSIMFGEPGLPGEGGAGSNDGVEGVAQEILPLD